MTVSLPQYQNTEWGTQYEWANDYQENSMKKAISWNVTIFKSFKYALAEKIIDLSFCFSFKFRNVPI